MKTETRIVQENIYILRNRKFKNEDIMIDVCRLKCEEHKSSCQRFLEFLEEEMKRWMKINELSDTYISTGELEEKITDLKQSIKLYNEAGI